MQAIALTQDTAFTTGDLREIVERAGFEIQHAQHDASRVHSAYSCIKRR